MAWLWKGSASHGKRPARELLKDFGSNETAATSIEYALIAVVLAGCLIVALPLIAVQLAQTFTLIAGYFAAILSG